MTVRKAVLTLACAAVVAVVASTAQAGHQTLNADAKAVDIAFFEFATANTWTQGFYQGAMAAAKKLGNVRITQFDGQANPEKQAKDLQDALASGKYNAWMIYQLGPAAYRYAGDAVKAGVKVAGVQIPFGPVAAKKGLQIPGQTIATYDRFAGPNSIGNDIGTLIVKACQGIDPCKVGYIYGYIFVPHEPVIQAAINAAIKAHPNIKIVVKAEGKYLADPAYKNTQDILQAHPDVNVIATGGDQMTAGAERAVRDAGKTAQVKLIGSFASQIGAEALAQKRWFGDTISLPYDEGRVAVASLVAAVRGKPLPYGPNPDVPKLFSPVGRLITQGNVAKFKAQWQG